jgi:Translation initiation factor 6 (eIF-6)
MFVASGPGGFLLPDVVRERELESLRDAGVDFSVMESRDTALGNLVLSNSSGAYASPALSDRQEEIEQALGVPVEFGTVGGVPSPGACGVTNERGAVLHRGASESEAEDVKEVLELEQVDIGTINTGSPFVGGGAVVQGGEVVTGENTSGPEIGRLDRTLG